MNKNTYIGQFNFNGNLNGHYGYSNGWVYTSYTTWVNNELVGLDYWRGKLRYYIR